MMAVWVLLAMLVGGVYLGVAARHGVPTPLHFVQTLRPTDCPVLSETSTCFSLELHNTGQDPASLACTTQDIKTGESVEFENALQQYHTGVVSPGETRTIGVWVQKPAGVVATGVPSVTCNAE
jgi:hypothetical protein